MTDLTLPDERPNPVDEARQTVLSRCAELGVVGCCPLTGACSEPMLRGALTDAFWLERVARSLRGGTMGRVSPGISVLRLVTPYRAMQPMSLDFYAFDAEDAADWRGSPVPRPAIRATTHEQLVALEPALRWATADALTTAEATVDIGDLADQLASAYETLDLLYSLGRSMTDLGRPEHFIRQACDRLRETTCFGYVAVHVPESDNVGDELAGRTVWSGDPGGTAERQTLDRLVSAMARLGEVSDAFRGPQALVRPLQSDRGLAGMIVAGDKQREGGNVSSYDTKLLDAAGGFISTFLTNSRLYAEQRRLVMGVLESLSAAIDAKDPYTRGHSQRVSWISHQIALALGFDEEAAERLRIAGLLHDVGKIGVPETVLRKNGKLTDDEFDEIKKHPAIGHRILKDLAGLEDVLPAVLHHHERIDGRGYPHGLSGTQIPLVARIVACADTFDAMSSTRSYRQKMPRDVVLEELRRSEGTQLDGRVVEAFMTLDLRPFDEMLLSAAPPIPAKASAEGDVQAA
ncbi:MAG: HD-GYP domain-containing protein [Phycisphaerales bacterium]